MKVKKILYLYIANTYGFHEQEFNFGNDIQYQFCESVHGFLLKKLMYGNSMIENIRKNEIIGLHLFTGNNGYANTGIMSIMCQWLYQLSKGEFPKDRGVIIFQDGEKTGFIGFDGGKNMDISTELDNLVLYNLEQVKIFLKGVKIVGLSHSLVNSERGKRDFLVEYSQKSEVLVTEEHSEIVKEILRNAIQDEFSMQIDFISNDLFSFPLEYICLDISRIEMMHLKIKMEEKYCFLIKTVTDSIVYYFGDYYSISKEKAVCIELLRAIFWGIIWRLYQWEWIYIERRQSTGKNVFYEVFEKVVCLHYIQGSQNNIKDGIEWMYYLIKDLLSAYQNEIEKIGYKKEFEGYWKSGLIESIKKIFYSIMKVLYSEKIYELFSDIYISASGVINIRLTSKNRTLIKKLWDIYKTIFLYVDFVNIFCEGSNKVQDLEGLISILIEESEKCENVICFYGEMDDTFRLEGKERSIDKLAELIRINWKGDSIQFFASMSSLVLQHDIVESTLIKDFNNVGTYVQNINMVDRLRKKSSYEVTLDILNRFKDWVEFEKGWEFIQSSEKRKREKFIQRLIHLVARNYLECYDMDISFEADAGRGPVDFKISYGGDKTIVEMKLSTNSQYLHGYNVQILEYGKAENTDKMIYVYIDLGNPNEREKLLGVYQENKKSGKKVFPELLIIDAVPKKAASTYMS